MAPAERMGDAAIRDLVRDALLEEPALAECSTQVFVKKRRGLVRIVERAIGAIDVAVEDGVVTLDGEVSGLVLTGLARVLVWWIAGSRDVINRIGVVSPEDDDHRCHPRRPRRRRAKAGDPGADDDHLAGRAHGPSRCQAALLRPNTGRVFQEPLFALSGPGQPYEA